MAFVSDQDRKDRIETLTQKLTGMPARRKGDQARVRVIALELASLQAVEGADPGQPSDEAQSGRHPTSSLPPMPLNEASMRALLEKPHRPARRKTPKPQTTKRSHSGGSSGRK